MYAGGLLLPVLLAATLASRKPALAWSVVAAALLAARSVQSPPEYAPELNLGLEESRYLAARLGPKDLILALSEPDWSLSYGLAKRVPIVALSSAAETERGPGYGERRAPYDATLERELEDRICTGGTVIFAADKMFRSRDAGSKAVNALAETIFEKLKKRFVIENAWISPLGQHYLPLGSSRCGRFDKLAP